MGQGHQECRNRGGLSLDARSFGRALALAVLSAGLAAGAGSAGAQGNANCKSGNCGAPKKRIAKAHRPKIEKLACRLGTEDQHARIAVELHDGKVYHFAYYSKWKPRTCSMDVLRDDAYSKWEDTGNTTIVTLIDDTGAFLIDHARDRYKFIFREIDRTRYCGMDGKVSGSLTIFRNKPQCVLEGVMDQEGNVRPDKSGTVTRLPPSSAEPPAAGAGGATR